MSDPIDRRGFGRALGGALMAFVPRGGEGVPAAGGLIEIPGVKLGHFKCPRDQWQQDKY